MAMTAIPLVPGHDFSLGMAASGYREQGAIAAGVGVRAAENAVIKLNTSGIPSKALVLPPALRLAGKHGTLLSLYTDSNVIIFIH
ncbi:YadA-like family protein [Apirhabdus apintestini]|nr:YadA-like family protein [Enterobacteriaceae bacterium CA-0114]